MRLYMLWIMVAVLVQGKASAQAGNGAIRGIVIDIAGQPVEKGKVTVDPIDGKVQASIVHSVESNREGRFEITGLALAAYKVFAMKEDDGYPNTMLAFYSGNKFTTVNLSRGTASANVILTVGPRAGTLVVSVTDTETGGPIDATLTMRRSDNPSLWMSTSVRSGSRVLVPSETSVSIEAFAADHEKWYLPASDKGSEALRLMPGEERWIRLVPSHPVQ